MIALPITPRRRWYRPSMSESELRLRDLIDVDRMLVARQLFEHRRHSGAHTRGFFPSSTSRHGDVHYIRSCNHCRWLASELRHLGDFVQTAA